MSDQQQSLEQEILADARRRAERATQRARRDAERIVGEARESAQQERDRLMASVHQRVERQERMQKARLEQELLRMRRQAFQDVLERVRAEARDELSALAASEEGRQVLVRLAVSAIDAMRGERFRLALSAGERQRWGEGLAQDVEAAVSAELGRAVSVELDPEELKARGGLTVRGEGTRELVDQTFEARMGRLWDDIRGHVAGMLGHVWDGINERSER
jgi:vacuolar-type H+-ATPase subunit E/Vma4